MSQIQAYDKGALDGRKEMEDTGFLLNAMLVIFL